MIQSLPEDIAVLTHEMKRKTLMSAEFGTPDDGKLDILATLIEVYKARHFPITELKGTSTPTS